MAVLERSGPLQSGLCQVEWMHTVCEGWEPFMGPRFDVELPASLSERQMEEAVGLLVARHEVLRTTFTKDESGHAVQHVWRPERVPLREPDDTLRAPFRIEEEWPVRAAVTERGDGTRQLTLVVAHITCDAGAMDILQRELRTILNAIACDERPELPPVEHHPVDQALLERSEHMRAVRARNLRFWEEEFRHLPSGPFAVPVIPADVGYHHVVLDSSALGPALSRIRRRLPVSSAFLAAVALAVSAVSGHDRIALATSWSSRSSELTRQMIGSVMRDLVLAVGVPGSGRFRDMAESAVHASLRAARRSDFDVLELLEAEARAGRRRGARTHPGMYVNFHYDAPAEGADGDTSADLSSLLPRGRTEYTYVPPVPSEHVPHVLYVSAAPGPEGRPQLFLSANDAVLSAEDTRALMLRIERILVRFAEDPGLDCAEFLPNPRLRDGEWVTVDGSWAALRLIEGALREHPAVSAVRAFTDDGGSLCAAVTVAGSDTDAYALRRFLLNKVDPLHALVVPDRFLINGEPAGGGRGTEPRSARPATDRERALHDAVVQANGLEEVSVHDGYVEAGGRLADVPKVLELLARQKLTGLRFDDFRRPCDLSALATRLSFQGAPPATASAAGHRARGAFR
ncbi:condensation domain-containing protein [Streptomyces sp. NPDC058335]|uniref:condensation domain-containing protein n=1 Tax=Streptomyces sp. NPDC058335 TaxID=3346451 RepID=UPI003646FA6A